MIFWSSTGNSKNWMVLLESVVVVVLGKATCQELCLAAPF